MTSIASLTDAELKSLADAISAEVRLRRLARDFHQASQQLADERDRATERFRRDALVRWEEE